MSDIKQKIEASSWAQKKNTTTSADFYFGLKKSLTIAAILTESGFETPFIVEIFHNESVYNVHTGKIIVSGGTPVGFVDHIYATYNNTVLDKDIRDRSKLLLLIDDVFRNLQLIEFIDLSKMSIEEYLTQWGVGDD